MPKTLIVYGTRKGASRDSSNVIAEILKNQFSHAVEVIDAKQIRKQIMDLTEYDNIIVGSSIAAGRWSKHAKNFLKNNNFNNKKLVIFVSAGGTIADAEEKGISKEEAVDNAMNNYVNKVVEAFNLNPIAKTAFGGYYIMFGKEMFNSWNKEDIEEWAKELGNNLQ